MAKKKANLRKKSTVVKDIKEKDILNGEEINLEKQNSAKKTETEQNMENTDKQTTTENSTHETNESLTQEVIQQDEALEKAYDIGETSIEKNSEEKQTIEKEEIVSHEVVEKEIVVIIPSHNPESDLIKKIDELIGEGFNNIIVVDDGSSDDVQNAFEKIASKVHLLKHATCLGKGRALKTGMNYAMQNFKSSLGAIILDNSLNYEISSILVLRDALYKNPDKLILATRNFENSNKNIWSLLASKITSAVFWILTQISYSDSQCSLRAIPYSTLETMVKVKGEDYEYKNLMLVEARKKTIDFVEVPIEEKVLEQKATERFLETLRVCKSLLPFALFPLIAVFVNFLFCLYFIKWFGLDAFNPIVIYTQGLLLVWIIFSATLKEVKIFETFKVVLIIIISTFLFFMVYAPKENFFQAWFLSGVLVAPINYAFYLRYRHSNPPTKIRYKN